MAWPVGTTAGWSCAEFVLQGADAINVGGLPGLPSLGGAADQVLAACRECVPFFLRAVPLVCDSNLVCPMLSPVNHLF